jgi:hypothetical protein
MKTKINIYTISLLRAVVGGLFPFSFLVRENYESDILRNSNMTGAI